MLSGHHAPEEVVNHGGIFVLSTTVIGVQVSRLLLAHDA